MKLNTEGTIFENWGKLAAQLKHENQDIAIYGFGVIGRRLIPVFLSLGFTVTKILDKDPNYTNKHYMGIPVVHPDKYTDFGSIIVVCAGLSFDFIVNYLRKRGFDKILPYFFYIFDSEITVNSKNIEDVQAYQYMIWESVRKKNNYINYIDIPITMRCSLRCKDCANLMQYFSHPQNADFEQMCTAVDRLFYIIEHIFEIRILGGEPFVNLELYKYLDFLDKHPSKYTLITIYTNGTIIPNQRTLDALKKAHISVRISNYANSKQKIAELSKTFDENGILYYATEVGNWQDCATLRNYGRTDEENAKILHNCCVKDCLSIVDGKIFRCPYAGNLYTLSAVPRSEHEYVDLLDIKLSADEIRNQINTLLYAKNLKVCNYCGGRPTKGNAIPPALQTDRPLEYKIYS